MNNTIAEEALILCKQMFAHYTQTDIEYAKKLIELEERFNANKSDKTIVDMNGAEIKEGNNIPVKPPTMIFTTSEAMKNKVVTPPSNDDDDLPF